LVRPGLDTVYANGARSPTPQRGDTEGGVKGNGRSVYRFRREVRFAKPPAAIWPFVSDTARLWDLNGYAPVQFDERVDAQGRVRRFVNGKLGFFPARWEEDFGEWQENHRLFQVREYQNGPMRRWEWACELIAEGEGCRLIFTGMAEPAGLLGFVGKHTGVFDAAFGKAAAGIERIIRESDGSALVPGWSAEDLVEPAARQRLDALGAELAGDPDSHALGPNLIDYLRHAPIIDLRSIRPVALAKLWSVPSNHAVELFLAAARKGVVAMGWELLCPRCRGAKSRVSRLQDLPKGAHCSSCNIDYGRNFSRNVELTFHPASWIRPLSDGEMCMLGPALRDTSSFRVRLPRGPPRPSTCLWRRAPTVFAPSKLAAKLIATSAPTASSRRWWLAAPTFCSKKRAAEMNSRSATRPTSRSPSSSRTAIGPRKR
jgi:hypothetical protein